MMRAVVLRQFGDPKNLKVEEVPTPEPNDGEALVEVRAASINPSDVKNAAGVMHGTTLPRIPGRDFAGVVVRGPKDIIGQEVFGTGGDIGFTRDGSHAQFILLPLAALTQKPARLSMDQAGSAGLTYVTAWSAIVTAADVRAGEVVVVVGASGGVGSASVRIAKALGGRVIGAVRSDDDFAAVRDNGADEVINTRSASLAEVARLMTGGRGANVVFDTSGMMFADAIEAADHGGRIPLISASAKGTASFNLRNLYRKELRVTGIDTRRLDVVACAQLLAAMAQYFKSGQFKIQPGQPHTLDEAVEAYMQAANGCKGLLRPN
jgi:NADPH:quinone reductase-like Zn-dependent oxidoreductase